MKSTGTLPVPGLKTELYLFGLIYWIVWPANIFLAAVYPFLDYFLEVDDILEGDAAFS